MRLLLIFALTLITTAAICQDSLKIKEIDSLITYQENQASRIITDKVLPTKKISIDSYSDTIMVVYKYSVEKELIEYSRIWVDQRGPNLIESFYFHKESLIKTLTRIPFESFSQFAYFDKKQIIYSGDTDGEPNPNIKSSFSRSQRILKQAKLIAKYY